MYSRRDRSRSKSGIENFLKIMGTDSFSSLNHRSNDYSVFPDSSKCRELINAVVLDNGEHPRGIGGLGKAVRKIREDGNRKGWPLLSQKPQTHKCDKCRDKRADEYFSLVNCRRHMRWHLKTADKDELSRSRDQIAVYWDKLSCSDAAKILNIADINVDMISGPKTLQAFAGFLQHATFLYPTLQYYRAAAMIENIQKKCNNNASVSSDELFKALDEASEKTFLTVTEGISATAAHYICKPENSKVIDQDRNSIAFFAFLVEHKLVKGWDAANRATLEKELLNLAMVEQAEKEKQEKALEKKRSKKQRQKEKKAAAIQVTIVDVPVDEARAVVSSEGSDHQHLDTSYNGRWANDEVPVAEKKDQGPVAETKDEEPVVEKKDEEPDTRKEDEEPDTRKKDEEPDTRKEDAEPDTRKKDEEPDTRKEDEEPDTRKEDEEPDTRKEDAEPDTRKKDEEPDTLKVPGVEEVPVSEKDDTQDGFTLQKSSGKSSSHPPVKRSRSKGGRVPYAVWTKKNNLDSVRDAATTVEGTSKAQDGTQEDVMTGNAREEQASTTGVMDPVEPSPNAETVEPSPVAETVVFDQLFPEEKTGEEVPGGGKEVQVNTSSELPVFVFGSFDTPLPGPPGDEERAAEAEGVSNEAPAGDAEEQELLLDIRVRAARFLSSRWEAALADPDAGTISCDDEDEGGERQAEVHRAVVIDEGGSSQGGGSQGAQSGDDKQWVRKSSRRRGNKHKK